MYALIQNFLRSGHRLRPGGRFIKLTITIHSTGNESSTAPNERAWLDNPGNTRDASWHYVIGENIVIQALPDDEQAWHCANAVGNRFSIGIEIVETGNRKAVLETAAEFTASKLKEYGWDLTKLKTHNAWTGKNCPRILIDKFYIKNGMDWNYFVGRIETFLKPVQEDEEMEKKYNTIGEVPEWAQATITKLIQKGYLFGDAAGNLGLTETALKVFVVNNRAKLYD